MARLDQNKLKQEITSAQKATSAWVNVGSELDVREVLNLGYYIQKTINSSSDLRFRLVCSHTSGGDTFLFPINSVGASVVKVEGSYYELNVDDDIDIYLPWGLDDSVNFVQLQVQAGTVAALADVATLTFPDTAVVTDGDYISITAQVGTTFAVALESTGMLEVSTLNFPDTAEVTAGDYITITAQDGTVFAVALDTTGSDTAPSGALWAAADFKVQTDISALVNDEDIAAAVEVDLNALTGFTALITTNDEDGDGTMTLTQTVMGITADPVPKDEDDTGAGSITTEEIVAGVEIAAVPTGALWLAADFKTLVSTGDLVDDEDIAARVETALNALTGFTAAITTDDTEADGTMTLTQVATGVVAAPVPKSEDDSGVGSITTDATTPGTSEATVDDVYSQRGRIG